MKDESDGEDEDEGDESDVEQEEFELKVDQHGRILVSQSSSVQYGFRSLPHAIDVGKGEELSNLVADCKTACSAKANKGEGYSSGQTYFIRGDEAPRCGLEKLAKDIFAFHAGDALFDPSRSGAEWWTLILKDDATCGFHWDRDYGLEGQQGIYIHPHIGTVSYLSDVGAPTLMFQHVSPLMSNESKCGDVKALHISYPKVGKHISFDGRLLHGVPVEFLPAEAQASSSNENGGAGRVSFLVNVWLNHIPQVCVIIYMYIYIYI
jgi:hypothetical protein